jgi:hypothetical protein
MRRWYPWENCNHVIFYAILVIFGRIRAWWNCFFLQITANKYIEHFENAYVIKLDWVTRFAPPQQVRNHNLHSVPFIDHVIVPQLVIYCPRTDLICVWFMIPWISGLWWYSKVLLQGGAIPRYCCCYWYLNNNIN